MNENHLTKFQVENFKRFEKFEMDNLGQFNLIVGDNNVGKTSVLEALLVDIEINPVKSLYNLYTALVWRKLTPQNTSMYEFDYLETYLFNKDRDSSIRFKLSDKKGNDYSIELKSMYKGNILLEELTESNLQLKLNQFPNKNHWFKYNLNSSVGYDNLYNFNYFDEEFTYVPMIPFNLGFDQDLVRFFSKYFQNSTNRLNELISKLSFFIPSITDIEIYQQNSNMPLILVVRQKNIDYTLPITQMGGGTVGFARIMMELLICKDQKIMIDEIDAGIHHSKLKQYLKAIIKTASENNVQIFATTHSAECIKFYKEALEELEDGKHKDNARIIHLQESKKDKSVSSYSLKFDEFAHSVNYENELR